MGWSAYDVQIVRKSDRRASPLLGVTTTTWGDATGDGTRNILDVSAVVDTVKQVSSKLPKVQAQLQQDAASAPDPLMNINVLDISNAVDALKGLPYPFGGLSICP